MTKNKPIYQVEDEKSRFHRDFSIDLRSERDKSVYFWSLGTYLLYNAIITRKKKQKLTLFSF